MSIDPAANNLEEYLDPIAYDLENQRFDPDGSFYAGLAHQVGGPVLEIGAGTGRIAIPLAKAGFAVTGLDLAAPMLEHARTKSGDLPVRWILGDATNLDLEERFGLIFIGGHGFQAFLSPADLGGLLRSVRRHLRPGGLFAFETRNAVPYHLEDDLVETEWFQYDHPTRGRVHVSGEQVYDGGQQIQTYTTYRRWVDAQGRPQMTTAKIRLRYAAPAELDALLEAHGFEVVARYGDWDRSPVTAESRELIYVARARA